MKRAALVLNNLLHPLLFPTLGMLIILNSGSYLSLMSGPIKRALVLIIALGTLLFPALMLLFAKYRKLDRSGDTHLLPQFMVLVLYLITMIYFLRLPVNHVLHAYMISVVAVLFVVLLAGIRLKLSLHGAASGALAALLVSLMLLFSHSLQGLLMLVILLAGLSGSVEVYLERHRPAEVFQGWILGFIAVMATFLIY